MNIIFEDEDIIVISKPSGLATQSANVVSKDCVSLLKEHLSSSGQYKDKEPYLGVIHRLDQPVAGILVFAKNEEAAAKLSKQVQSDIMSKEYHALVEGKCDSAENVELINYLYKDSKENKAIITKESRSNNKNIKIQKAVLSYTTEEFDDEGIAGILDSDTKAQTSLLKIVLKTGRFHQIRVQLSNMGHPIAGDRKYGSKISCPLSFANGNGANKGAIALVADRLEFRHPRTNKILHFEL